MKTEPVETTKTEGHLALKPHHYQWVCEAIASHPEITAAWIFGSRAMGTYKESSDIDIALEGQHIDLDILASLHEQFEYSTLPFQVDQVVKAKVNSPELLAHIERYGLPIRR
jgi:predicted nucleotidyltransferase